MPDAIKGDRVRFSAQRYGTVLDRHEGGNGDIPELRVRWDDGSESAVLCYEVTVSQRVRSCATCGAVIEYEFGVYGPPGWQDVSVMDIDNNGMTCPATGDCHVPAAAGVTL